MGDNIDVPNWMTIRSKLHRIRAAAMLSLKTGIESSQFLKNIVIEQRFVVFASDTIIARVAQLPSEQRHIAKDCTYKVVPVNSSNCLL